MEIKQILLSKMMTFAYMVGDKQTKTCALIDPAFDTGRILKTVEQAGYRVSHLINTHGHSDHTAGNQVIKAATGAQLMIHAADAPRLSKMLQRAFSRMLGGKGSPVPDILLQDNELVEIGAASLKVIHTPGHTPGGICLYGEGHLFTGDSLFVGAVGRTDLPGGSARQLLTSIREKIYPLPGDTIIWPGHNYGSSPSSTVEQEMRTNPFTQ